MAREKTATELNMAAKKFWQSMNEFNKDAFALAYCECDELGFSWCEYFEESPSASPTAYRNAVYDLARNHWEIKFAAHSLR